MPRYYFDVVLGPESRRDEVGEELADDATAWAEALHHTRELEDSLAPGGQWQMRVRREDVDLFEIDVATRWLGSEPEETS